MGVSGGWLQIDHIKTWVVFFHHFHPLKKCPNEPPPRKYSGLIAGLIKGNHRFFKAFNKVTRYRCAWQNSLPRHDLGLGSFTGHWMPEEAIVKAQVPGVGVNGFFSVTKKVHFSAQIIATSHDLTPKGGLVREIPLFQENLGRWNIIDNLARFFPMVKHIR